MVFCMQKSTAGLHCGAGFGLRQPVPNLVRSASRRLITKIRAVASIKDDIVEPKPRNEEARQYFRSVYDFAAWQKHRNPYRYFSRLSLIPQSHILQNVMPSITWVLLVSATVGLYETARSVGIIPPTLPDISENVACSNFTSMTSVALSLLLVFRTNSSYGRWDEVRKMWGGLLNRSRDLALQVASYTTAEDAEAKKAMHRWIITFAHVLRIHVQNEGTVRELCGKLLTPAEIEMLEKSSHKPMTALAMLMHIISRLNVGISERQSMLNNLTFFQDVLGGCERILRAPIPVSYTRHTARFMIVWLTTLPFALWPSCGWASFPLSGAIAAVLGGIEEIGVQCEEPFGILPLDVISGRISLDVTYALQESSEAQVRLMVAEALSKDKGSNGLDSREAVSALSAAGQR